METNQEKLDRIEFSGEGLEDDDFEWLIEQASQVQDLQRKVEYYEELITA